MSHSAYIDLDDCTEIKQVMRRRPPMLAHATVVVLGVMIGVTVVWLATSRADLVVVSQGLVRPLTESYPVVSGERFAVSTGGRVVEVGYIQGQRVSEGDVLLRLDTTWLDREIATREHQVSVGVAELERLHDLEVDRAVRFEARVREARGLVDQAKSRLGEAQDRRDQEVRLAAVKARQAHERVERIERLSQHKAASPEELVNAQTEADLAAASLAIAELPVDGSEVGVLERQCLLVERDYEVQRREFAVDLEAKRGEVDRIKIELATLAMEREQSVIVAPASGVMTTLEPKVGDVIKAGQVVAEIAEEGGLRLDVAVTGDDVGHIEVGMPVRVKLDAYDYQEYGTVRGTVDFVSPDSTIVDGDSANAGAAVFMTRIVLDGQAVGRGTRTGQVKIGMAGMAEIRTDQKPLFSLLMQRIDRAIRLN